jgi:hypothetical protein
MQVLNAYEEVDEEGVKKGAPYIVTQDVLQDYNTHVTSIDPLYAIYSVYEWLRYRSLLQTIRSFTLAIAYLFRHVHSLVMLFFASFEHKKF